MRSIAVSVSLSVYLAYLKNSWQRARMDKASSVVTPSSIASYTPCVESGGGTPRRRSAAGNAARRPRKATVKCTPRLAEESADLHAVDAQPPALRRVVATAWRAAAIPRDYVSI